MITWTKFVLHELVDDYKAAGWVLGGDLRGTPHGHWSVIMKWAGEGEPRIPTKPVADEIEKLRRGIALAHHVLTDSCTHLDRRVSEATRHLSRLLRTASDPQAESNDEDQGR